MPRISSYSLPGPLPRPFLFAPEHVEAYKLELEHQERRDRQIADAQERRDKAAAEAKASEKRWDRAWQLVTLVVGAALGQLARILFQ